MNDVGELGDGTTKDRSNLKQIGHSDQWDSVSARYFHAAAIRTNGSLWTWGSNSAGKLGDGTTTNRSCVLQ